MPSLASDVNNPEFTNPQHPDASLHVEFYMFAPLDKWESDKQSYEEGRKVEVRQPEMPFVRIAAPGSPNSIIEEKVREDHKRRFPNQWLYFAMNEGLIEEHIQGWRIEDWGHLNENQVRDLKHMRFNTVEQIANASDSAIQGMGMMGPGLRIEARKAIDAKLENRVQVDSEDKDRKIADLTEQVQKLMDKVDEMGKPKKVK